MWLRLARRYGFAYCPQILTRYRIVKTAVTRTAGSRNAERCISDLLISAKCLTSGALDHRKTRLHRLYVRRCAQQLHELDHPDSQRYLWRALRGQFSWRTALYVLFGVLGVSRAIEEKALLILGGCRDQVRRTVLRKQF